MYQHKLHGCGCGHRRFVVVRFGPWWCRRAMATCPCGEQFVAFTRDGATDMLDAHHVEIAKHGGGPP